MDKINISKVKRKIFQCIWLTGRWLISLTFKEHLHFDKKMKRQQCNREIKKLYELAIHRNITWKETIKIMKKHSASLSHGNII